MNIYDIAEKAGVSIATVSRTLNGGPVKEKTKKRILEIIEEEGYIPNVYAKNLNSQSVKIVGVFLPDIEDIYGSRVVAVLEMEMKKKGYDMILYNIGDGIDQISK
ncbi:MAG: LacI family DNA-binding transcriptional regulator, partial [Clostridia bacterium]|nr:LacI family DNA-binding transcriptional regulator [Clostridia bacterium]